MIWRLTRASEWDGSNLNASRYVRACVFDFNVTRCTVRVRRSSAGNRSSIQRSEPEVYWVVPIVIAPSGHASLSG
jgi:hypothetical protein